MNLKTKNIMAKVQLKESDVIKIVKEATLHTLNTILEGKANEISDDTVYAALEKSARKSDNITLDRETSPNEKKVAQNQHKFFKDEYKKRRDAANDKRKAVMDKHEREYDKGKRKFDGKKWKTDNDD
jgi:hypothetical protein